MTYNLVERVMSLTEMAQELESYGLDARARICRTVDQTDWNRCGIKESYRRVLMQERAKHAARGLLERLWA